MARFIGLTVGGLTIGTIYAVMSLGVVVIYRISRIVNLAHGAIGVFSAYVFHYTLVQGAGLPVTVAFVLTLFVGAAVGLVVERFFVGPVRSEGMLTTTIMTVGVLLVLTELTVQFWGPDTPVIDSPFSDRTVTFAGTGITVHQIGTAVLTGLLLLGMYLVLSKTRYGKAVQAIAEDPGAARIVGIPVRLITTATWAIGGASAALAGMLYIHLNVLDPISLTFVLISSLVAAVIGGFNSLSLAVGGSLAVGVGFELSKGYISTPGAGDLLVVVVLVGVLLAFRHQAVALESVSEL